MDNLKELLASLSVDEMVKLQELALERKKSEEDAIREKITALEAELVELKKLLPQEEKKVNSNSGVSRPRTGITKWLLERVTREGTNLEIMNEIKEMFPESEAKVSAVAWARAKVKKGG